MALMLWGSSSNRHRCLCQCNVLLRSNTLKDLLVLKVNCIPVNGIVSALCMKYDAHSKNLRVYISLQVVTQLVPI